MKAFRLVNVFLPVLLFQFGSGCSTVQRQHESPATTQGLLTEAPGDGAGRQDEVLGMARCLKTVNFVARDYEPNKLVVTVNTLRAMGREGALEILRMYFASDPMDLRKDEDIQIICRFLFVRPGGWEPPTLGDPFPYASPNGADRFPCFPVAASNGIPFLLASGFMVGGGGPQSWATLVDCQHLPLIDHDMEVCNRNRAVAAAEALTSSDTFKHRNWRSRLRSSNGRQLVWPNKPRSRQVIIAGSGRAEGNG
jgi:hypothetical protein